MTLKETSEAIGKGPGRRAGGDGGNDCLEHSGDALSRAASDSVPSAAAAKVLGVEFTGDREKERFSTLVHWGYGTAWGRARGVIGGLRGRKAAAVHYVTVWGSGW